MIESTLLCLSAAYVGRYLSEIDLVKKRALAGIRTLEHKGNRDYVYLAHTKSHLQSKGKI